MNLKKILALFKDYGLTIRLDYQKAPQTATNRAEAAKRKKIDEEKEASKKVLAFHCPIKHL